MSNSNISRFGVDARTGKSKLLAGPPTSNEVITNDSTIAAGTTTYDLGAVTADSYGVYALWLDGTVTVFGIGSASSALVGTWGSTTSVNLRVNSGRLELQNYTGASSRAAGTIKIVRLA